MGGTGLAVSMAAISAVVSPADWSALSGFG
jgi:hypothetical protein